MSQRGVGLGLSIVERICKVLNLELELVSRAGSGSMFAVHVQRTTPIIQSATRPFAVASPMPGSFDGVRVLCLDNEPAVLAGMEALLKGWNCSVEMTAGAEAVLLRRMGFPASSKIWPDVILADYHLDHGTGVEAIARLRAAAKSPIPAVIITADHSTEVQREIKNGGFAHLKKPIKPAALRAALAQALISSRHKIPESVPGE
jgi:CheY-like chemotaxis protein